MNSVVAVLLVGLAVAYGQTTIGQVNSCRQTASATCRSQCLSTITDPNVQAKVSSCFQQGDAQRTQFEATKKACLDQAVGGSFDAQPCFAKTGNNGGFGGKGGKSDHGGKSSNAGGFGSSQISSVMSAFHTCSRTCMQRQVTPCAVGCTGTVSAAVQNAFKTCKSQKPPITTGTFDMRTCMKNAVGTA